MKTDHILDASRDDEYLGSGRAVNSLWIIPLSNGESICVCASCRGAVASEDWQNRDCCPVCESPHKLYFEKPNDLLRTETVIRGGIEVERPVTPILKRLEEVDEDAEPVKDNWWYLFSYLERHMPDFILGGLCMAACLFLLTLG